MEFFNEISAWFNQAITQGNFPLLFRQTLIYAVPLMIVALAGVFSERSGTINLALEGIMIFGAFIGVMFVRLVEQWGWFDQAYNAKDWLTLQGFAMLAMAVTAIFCTAFAMLLAFAAIHLRADQTIGGTALNLLAPALVLFFIRLIADMEVLNIGRSASNWFMLKEAYFGFVSKGPKKNPMGFLGQMFVNQVFPMTYVVILLFIIMAVILYKTKFGLRLRACGENPQAAASLGINVYGMRYAGVAISGALGGIGGFLYAVTAASGSADGKVAGLGFLALAVMIFGNWKPLNIAGAAVLFGLCKCIAALYNNLDLNGDGIYLLRDLSRDWGISTHFYRLLPYIITLLVLAFTSKNSRAPKAEGIPYDKSVR